MKTAAAQSVAAFVPFLSLYGAISMKFSRLAALALAALAVFGIGAAVAQYATSNYMASGSDWEVGGTLNIKSGGALTFNGVDQTAALATAPAGVAAGYKIARGVTAVTGTNDLTTGLSTVVACTATLQEDAALTGNLVTVSIQTQSGGTAGHVTLKVWKPTASGDVTPIAATAAKNVGWNCTGT
jgi:hypothetical protein